MSLDITTNTVVNVLVVSFRGRLDTLTAAEAERLLAALIDAGEHRSEAVGWAKHLRNREGPQGVPHLLQHLLDQQRAEPRPALGGARRAEAPPLTGERHQVLAAALELALGERYGSL